MLQRVHMDGVELPRLYIAENREDAKLAKSAGIPYVRWTQGNDALITIMLRPTLEKLFPYIKWDMVKNVAFKTNINNVHVNAPDYTGKLDEFATDNHGIDQGKHDTAQDKDSITPGETGNQREETSDIADGTRQISGGDNDVPDWKPLSLAEYAGDLSSSVNLDVLQSLSLMPAFIGDILECVRKNIIAGVTWSEGWNKKKRAAIGNFDSSRQKPNLIILDVSGSIPRGIAATMLSLIDTLRTQVNAELIITASTSKWYGEDDELPSPQNLRLLFKPNNETHAFLKELTRHVQGRQWGHVFSFGDNDTPMYEYFETMPGHYSLQNTSVEYVHHYHTRYDNTKTGYAKWCHQLSYQPKVEYNNKWCNVIIGGRDCRWLS